jgi:probable F420-dependent oxidoreductase
MSKVKLEFCVGPGGIPTTVEEWAPFCRKLEDLGYTAVSNGDHPAMPRLGAIASTAAAAAATSKIRVGTLVYGNDYRHPLVLAREIATLDRMCGGRIEFGLGAGWYTADYEQFGWTWDRPGVRIERLAEAVQLVKRYFSGERFSLQGKHYSVRDVEGYPLPIQRPYPTLVMGGGGPKMLALAGREADIVDFNFALQSGNMTDWSGPTATRESTRAKLAAVHEGAKGRAVKPKLSVTLHGLGLTGDLDAAAAKAAKFYSLSVEQLRDSPHFVFGDKAAAVDKLLRLREEYGFTRINLSGTMINEAAPLVRELG